MGKLGLGRALECFSLSTNRNTCFCMNSAADHEDDGFEGKAFLARDQIIKAFEGNKTLAFHLAPKTVVLRVSMHCNGCAKKVQKHVSKIEGVTSFQVDLESKKVVVIGDITPLEVLESVSRIKFAELLVDTPF